MDSAPRALLQAALDDPEAFAAIVDHHKAMVFSIAYHFFEDRSLAEDLAQDVFLELYRRLSRIQSDAHLGHWLRQAISRRCIDQARKALHRRHLPLDEVPAVRVDPAEHDPFLSAALRARLELLPQRNRLILILRFQQELELAEIARLLSMPLNTVKSTLHRSLALLREQLSSVGNEKEPQRHGALGR